MFVQEYSYMECLYTPSQADMYFCVRMHEYSFAIDGWPLYVDFSK